MNEFIRDNIWNIIYTAGLSIFCLGVYLTKIKGMEEDIKELQENQAKYNGLPSKVEHMQKELSELNGEVKEMRREQKDLLIRVLESLGKRRT